MYFERELQNFNIISRITFSKSILDVIPKLSFTVGIEILILKISQTVLKLYLFIIGLEIPAILLQAADIFIEVVIQEEDQSIEK